MFTRRVADVISEACFAAMTEDHQDELAAMDLSKIARFVTFLIIPVLYCFVFEHETIYTLQVLAVFDSYYRT